MSMRQLTNSVAAMYMSPHYPPLHISVSIQSHDLVQACRSPEPSISTTSAAPSESVHSETYPQGLHSSVDLHHAASIDVVWSVCIHGSTAFPSQREGTSPGVRMIAFQGPWSRLESAADALPARYRTYSGGLFQASLRILWLRLLRSSHESHPACFLFSYDVDSTSCILFLTVCFFLSVGAARQGLANGALVRHHHASPSFLRDPFSLLKFLLAICRLYYVLAWTHKE